MMFESWMKRRGAEKLDAIVPNPYETHKRTFPIWAKIAVPAAGVAMASLIVLAVTLPLSLIKAAKDDRAVLGEILSHAEGANNEVQPFCDFVWTMKMGEVAVFDYGYNVAQDGMKYAVTISCEAYARIIAQGNKLSRNGHYVDYGYAYGLGEADYSCFPYKADQAIPASINGAPVVGVYYQDQISYEEELVSNNKHHVTQEWLYRASILGEDNGYLTEAVAPGKKKQVIYGWRFLDEQSSIKIGKEARFAGEIINEEFVFSESFYRKESTGENKEPYSFPDIDAKIRAYEQGETLHAMTMDDYRSVIAKYASYFRVSVDVPFTFKSLELAYNDTKFQHITVCRGYENLPVADYPSVSFSDYDETYFASNDLILADISMVLEHSKVKGVALYGDELCLTFDCPTATRYAPDMDFAHRYLYLIHVSKTDMDRVIRESGVAFEYRDIPTE